MARVVSRRVVLGDGVCMYAWVVGTVVVAMVVVMSCSGGEKESGGSGGRMRPHKGSPTIRSQGASNGNIGTTGDQPKYDTLLLYRLCGLPK